MKAYSYRLLFGIVLAWTVYWTASFKGDFPIYYYVVLLAIYASHQVLVYASYVSLMAFFARISDPAIGGTYMTLLNTLSNFGGNWPATFSMWLLDYLTVKTCSLNDTDCTSKTAEEVCAR